MLQIKIFATLIINCKRGDVVPFFCCSIMFNQYLKLMNGFQINQNKGFHLTFENNWTISVQFGNGNYCSRQNDEVNDFMHTSPNAEIAVWRDKRKDNGFITLGYDQVKGYCSPDEVAKVINIISKAKSTITNEQMSKKLMKIWSTP